MSRRPLLIRSAATASRATPMLDHLSPVGDAAGSIHRRSHATLLGPFDLSVEAMRQSGGGGDSTIPREKRLSFGLGSIWSVGADDFSLGLAVARMVRAQPDMLTARAHFVERSVAVGLSWAHDGWMRLDLGWRQDGASRALSGAERMVDIADGAPLREAGPRMALDFQSPHLDGAVFGIEAQDARVAKADIAWIGAAAPLDARIGFFARTRF